MATHSSIVAWRIPWTEDLGPQDHKESDTAEALCMHSGIKIMLKYFMEHGRIINKWIRRLLLKQEEEE